MNRDQYSAKHKFQENMVGNRPEQHVSELKRKNDATQSDTEEQVSDWQAPSPETSELSLDGTSRNA